MSTPLPSTQKHKNEKMTHLAKSSLPVKRRYFLRTNQLFCFRFDIDKVIRQTYTHTCMHTNIQRCTYIIAYMHEFIHKNKPPIITSTTDNGKMIFIHSFRIFLLRLFKFTEFIRAELHWLPMHRRIAFKILMLMRNCLADQAPVYQEGALCPGIIFAGPQVSPFCRAG